MKIIIPHFVPLVGLMLLCLNFGCRTVYTTVESPESGSINGILYYLPTGKITIKGEFKEVTPTPPPCPKCPPKGGKDDEPQSNLNATASATASPVKNPDEPGSTIGSASQLTISVTQEVEADASRVFYAHPEFNPIYEDEVKVAVNARHLLSTGKVTTEDKTVEIVGALASLASEVRGLVPSKSRQPFYLSFHPTNLKEVQCVQNELHERDITFTLHPMPSEAGKAVVVSEEQARQLGAKGLLFRPSIPYKIGLVYNSPTEPSRHLIKCTQQFLLPDPSRLYVIDYPRIAFVKHEKEIGFTNGMLTDFREKVPSPILGFLGIPKAIVQAMVPIPGAAPPSGGGSSSGTTGSH